MRAKAGLASLALAAASLGLLGCPAPPPPAPQPQPEPKKEEPATPEVIPTEPVESGQACAKAEAQCGGGTCELTLDNTCDAPMTCNLFILTICQAETDLVQVKARTRETFPAKKKDKVTLSATCQSGRVVSTKVQTLECK